MFPRKITFLITFVVLMLVAGMVTAQDTNWCHEGGKWYDPGAYAPHTNRCDAQPDAWSVAFMWANGWYGAQYDAGNITFEELFELSPTIAGNIITFDHPELLIPPETTPLTFAPTCYVGEGGSFWTTGEMFMDAQCMIPFSIFKTVIANDATEALTTCGIGYHQVAQPTTVPVWPTSLWHCFESP